MGIGECDRLVGTQRFMKPVVLDFIDLALLDTFKFTPFSASTL